MAITQRDVVNRVFHLEMVLFEVAIHDDSPDISLTIIMSDGLEMEDKYKISQLL